MKRRELLKQTSILLLAIMFFQSVEKEVNCVLVKRGKIFGTVKGEKGNHMVEAKITLTNVKTKKVFSTQTNLEGKFAIENIDSGEYLFIVEVPNYKTRIQRVIKIKQNIPRFEQIIFPDYSEQTLTKVFQQQEEANLLIEVISSESFYLLKPVGADAKENSFQILENITKDLEKDLVVVILGKQIKIFTDIERKNLVKKINLLLDNLGFKKVIFQQVNAFSFEIIATDFYK